MFIFAYNNTTGNKQVSVDSFKKYFLPRVKIDNYNIDIDGKNFQLMTQLNNMINWEKYQQDKMMIIQQVAY